MSEFTIRSESVDVEQIMKQIRQRVLEKRGADYTEDQIRELASVRLEKFLDPNNLRSDLLDQFRKSRPSPVSEPPMITPPYTTEQTNIFATHRGIVRLMRKLFSPLLKMMFNANTLHQVLHTQAQFNVDLLKREARRKIEFDRSRAEWNSLYYEVLHNLVLETTRMGIEVQNLRMKVESLSSRLDFSERRVRALEGVVQYRPEVVHGSDRRDERDEVHAPAAQASAGSGSVEGFVPAGGGGGGQPGQGDGSARRRRRRRRGRRGGQGAEGASGAFGASGAQGAQGAQGGQGAQGAQGAGPQDSEAYEAGESDGPDDGEEFENGDELSASGGFDVPEPVEEGAAPQAPDLPEVPAIPETLKTPEPGDDDLQ
jgi:hypothetical protein